MRQLDLQAKAPLYTHLLETVDGLTTIRAFQWQSSLRSAALQLLDDSQRPYYLLFCIQRWLSLVLDLFVAASAVLLVSFSVVTPAATSTGAVALYNVLSFSQTLANLISSWTQLETSLGAIARLRSFEAQTPKENPPKNPPVDVEQLATEWPAAGKVEIRDVTASYSPDDDGDGPSVLNNISLSINPGEKVAICGRTGSGKSSLLLTLTRLLEIKKGSIVIDNIDTSHMPQNDLRRHLIVVPQKPVLFPGSLRSNLVLHNDTNPNKKDALTDQAIIDALTKFSLWPLPATSSNEKNNNNNNSALDGEISDLSLSQGQRQLLCLARAVLWKENNKVVLLDEATSAVDAGTESMIARVLDTEFSEHTVISVVHRLHTVRSFDRVVVMDEGQVVKVGNPDEVLAWDGGMLRGTWVRDEDEVRQM
jgi:ABC-type multidrug transport system fused ATPase/permease subunit